MTEEYLILGAGGHAKSVVEAIEKSGNVIIGFTDQNMEKGSVCCGYSVLGNDDVLSGLYQKGIRSAAMGIGHVGNPSVRNKVFRAAQRIGFAFPNIVHPSAVLTKRIVCGTGTQFLANCVVNTEARIGDLCIINTAAVVEHEVQIGDGVHIAPHATVLGQAKIGDNTFIGAGSVILPGIRIGKNCIIGAGSVVLRDVEDYSVVAGNPGRLLRRVTT